jgi:F-type H+-transporting ATPase subunit b
VLIDWVTVAAQIVNFLILVVLLKIFLYDKIIEAMDKREQRIADRLTEAESRRQEAEEEKKKLREKQEQLARDRKEVMEEAERQAEARRKELVEKAGAEVDEMAENWRQALKRDQEDLVSELSRMTADQAVKIASRAVSDLAGAGISDAVSETFLKKLKSLSQEDRQDMADAAKKEGVVRVLCSGEPSAEEKQKITRAVHEHVSEDVEVKYEAGATRMGYVLKTRGRKFDWSLEGYLREYRERVRDALVGEIEKSETEGGAEGSDEKAGQGEKEEKSEAAES